MKLDNYLLLEVLARYDLSYCSLPFLILGDSLLLVFLILRILHAVMPEVESFCRLDNLPKPLGELCVVDFGLGLLGCIRRGLHLNQHLKKVEVKVFRTAYKVGEIFSRDETVVVCIDV